MSRQNIKNARRVYKEPIDVTAVLGDPAVLEAFRQQLEPLVEPNFETIPDPQGAALIGGGVRGIDGFVGIFRNWTGAFDSWVVTATDFIDLDEDRVLVMCLIEARSEAQQVELAVDGANLLTFRDGKLTRLELFLNRAGGLKAAGLSE